MIKICIVGSTQSGSTRLFNMVRLLFEMKKKKVLSGWDIKNFRGDHDVVVSKVHQTNEIYMRNFDFILLPVRNVLDSSISRSVRSGKTKYVDFCLVNIDFYNKFKNRADFIFRYEDYSIKHIKELCNVLNIELTNIEIIEVMRELDNMLHSMNMVKSDDPTNDEYKKTLLSQAHNTSGGASNKFIYISNLDLDKLLGNQKIEQFLIENNYI